MYNCLHTECDGKMFGKNCKDLFEKCVNSVIILMGAV